MMKIVSLICTVHAEMGCANVSELHALLERIRPQVIFLEAPANRSLESLILEDPNRLETAALIKYQDSNSAAVVPVDLATPDDSFFTRSEDLFRILEKTSYKYGELMDRNSERIRAEGFPYLNSESHGKYLSDLHQEILDSIKTRGDNWALEVYSKWTKTNNERDMGMISNIQKYCVQYEFSRAAFLVGAAHRNSILEKSKEQSQIAMPNVYWNYSGEGSGDNTGVIGI